MTGRRRPGVYHLVLRLRRARTIQVGRLGRFEFGAGYYVYTGSAMGGLEARIERHRRQRKKLWWHIDYLLRQAELVDVVAVPTSRRVECERNRWVLSLPGACVAAKGFGASDCNCVTHLVRLGEGPATVSALAGLAR
ncbi:MAG: GIY-YIG nuclease family protein [Armatimonadota bacterium]|nr:GIY-YIG nuclease family protein [Armatimonadota bacterium]